MVMLSRDEMRDEVSQLRDSSGASPQGRPGATLTTTLEGSITSADPAAARLFGYAVSDLVGRELKALMPPLRPGDEHAALARLQRGVGIGPLQTLCWTRSGEPLDVSVTLRPLFGADGAVDGIGVIVRALRPDEVATEAQARLAAIVDSSFDAIISKTLDGVITSWNRAAEALFGYTPEEAVGASILLIIPPERRTEEEAVLASIRRGELVAPFETVRVHKGGATVHVSLTISPVRDGTGRIIGASKIARDVAERLRAEEERARMLREMQASNRAKDEFLAMLGHELRNPLGALTTALELLTQYGSDDPTCVRARQIAQRQGQHLGKLIDDLLDVGRVMTGKIVVQPRPLDLGEATAAHLATLRAAGGLDRHTVSLEIGRAPVSADPVRLEQVIANLVGNALRYTPAGGHIRVVVGREGEHAVLRVEDDGVGIAPELLPQIFDLFVQSERRNERAQGGLGIGLTLVRRLVELQGGSVEATSEGLGRGSLFHVRLPLFRGELAPPEPEPAEHTQKRRRVLIVEDNDDAREMLRMLLEREGHEVHEAADGQAGVEQAVRSRPDVALVDLGLPVLDGYGAARAIRAQLGDEVLLVALTGYGSSEDRRRAMHAGFDRHLRKPLDLRELRGILEAADAHRAELG